MSSYSSDDDSYGSDEPPELELDLLKLMDRATEIFSATCISARRITRGTSHEVFILKFQPTDQIPHELESLASSGFSCIARFARVKDDAVTAKEESEIATIQYLKQHTSVPVPHIFYQDLDPDNEVGASYVLMEKLPGRHLYQVWDELPLTYKKAALSDIASVIVQFSSLQFSNIGSLRPNRSVSTPRIVLGPVFSPCYDSPQGPFTSTDDYLRSFLRTDPTQSPDLTRNYQQIQAEISIFLTHQDAAYLQPPFAFIHADFDAQNMLFSDSAEGPRLTGLIDFEFSFTGPLYFLYDYPIFIQDVDSEKYRYAENAVLRAHFVHQIYQKLPDAEARRTFIGCINAKNFTLNRFYQCFMLMKCSERTLLNTSTHYLKSLKEGTGLAYSGRLDYKNERYSDDGQPLHIDKPSEVSDTAVP